MGLILDNSFPNLECPISDFATVVTFMNYSEQADTVFL